MISPKLIDNLFVFYCLILRIHKKAHKFMNHNTSKVTLNSKLSMKFKSQKV